jgi:hypothetical protein
MVAVHGRRLARVQPVNVDASHLPGMDYREEMGGKNYKKV